MIVVSQFLGFLVGAAGLGLAYFATFRARQLGFVARKFLFFGFSILALLSGILGFAGITIPFLSFFSAIGGAISALLFFALNRNQNNKKSAIFLALYLLAAISLGVAQPLGLKVIMLPKAELLPFVPYTARVVKTYGEGVWFESVRANSEGTLYLSANSGLDFSHTDYYRNATGQVFERKLDGSEKVLFTTPKGSAAGVLAVAQDGALFMTSNADQPGLWRISQEGKGEKITTLPLGAWPNGLDFGPDGMLYSPDSNLGLIWRIDPHTGSAEKVIIDQLLEARPMISLAPGANGLHFQGNDLFVTVSDRANVLKYRLGEDHRFSKAEVIATGIPGDDFAIGKDGSLFITTHPYNTLVRVAPDGTRTIIADETKRIIGATDAVFGRGPHDRDVLYVVTDGGAFTGGPKTRGELIEVMPYATEKR